MVVDGLTAMLVKIARAASENNEVCFALAEGGTPEQIENIRKIGKVVSLPSRKGNVLLYMAALYRLTRKERFDIVHIHGNSATMAFDLLPAKLSGISVRITHCHNCAKQPWLKQKILGTLCNKWLTTPVACSIASGKMLYRQPFHVISNGIDCERFSFSTTVRNQMRQELGMEKAFIVGHMGRFNAQKNQTRLIDIFAEILKKNPAAYLILGGNGEELTSCKEKATSKGIAERVVFLGNITDPERYFCAMDVFVLPSIFEGLPLVGVEAQASGLPCVFSDAITKETRILPQTAFLPLEASNEQWAEAIVRMLPNDRENAAKKVVEAGFHECTLKNQVKELYGQN